MKTDDVRAMFRAGDKIGALRALRSDGASLAIAMSRLAEITSADDQRAFRAAVDARTENPWVETAPGILEPRNQVVCETCNDTHRMDLSGAVVNCTRCPVPCQTCRRGGNGAYCEHTPCSCACHAKRAS